MVQLTAHRLGDFGVGPDQWHTSGATWGALLIAGVLMLMNGLHRGEASFVNYMELELDRQKLEDRISQLKTDISNDKQEISRIRNSGEYAKKVLKEKYNVLEPGETVLLVPDE